MGFPYLFQEGNIGGCKLRNRIIMPLYPTKYSQDSRVNERILAFYKERARGGVALIVLDCPCLNYPDSYKGKNELRMDEPSYVEGIQKLLKMIHQEGARAFMHLNYPKERFFNEKVTEAKPKGDRWVQPLANFMTDEEAYTVIDKMVSGAKKAREIGYDGVDVQASYGDLISQLLSPLSNKRTDDFGGSLENRARFLFELIKGIKREAGDDFPAMIKLVCDEYVLGGITTKDSREIAKMAASAGADAIVANAGNKATKSKTIPPHSSEAGSLVHLASEIRKVVNIPVVAIGKINSPELADRVIGEGKADFVAMARPLVADPCLPQKALYERSEEIRSCIYCLEDCAQSGVPGLGRSCSVNPVAGQEYMMKIKPAKKKKKLVIIGGGPAGVQAAILASQRGHMVMLFEKENTLGGQFRLANRAPYKGEVAGLLRYLNYMLSIGDVKVLTNRHVGVEDIVDEAPDAVILATGSIPKVPDIPGVDLPFVYKAREVYEKELDPGKHVLILGGGDIGWETAEMLAAEDREITIIEILQDVLLTMKSIPKEDLLGRLKEKKVKMITDSEPVAIKPGDVWIKDLQGNRSSLKADSVIVAIGSVSENTLLEPLKQKIPEVYPIGEAMEPGNVGNCLRSAAKVALEI